MRIFVGSQHSPSAIPSLPFYFLGRLLSRRIPLIGTTHGDIQRSAGICGPRWSSVPGESRSGDTFACLSSLPSERNSLSPRWDGATACNLKCERFSGSAVQIRENRKRYRTIPVFWNTNTKEGQEPWPPSALMRHVSRREYCRERLGISARHRWACRHHALPSPSRM